MIDNEWTRRIRELEAENACYAIRDREFKAKIGRLEYEIELLREVILEEAE